MTLMESDTARKQRIVLITNSWQQKQQVQQQLYLQQTGLL